MSRRIPRRASANPAVRHHACWGVPAALLTALFAAGAAQATSFYVYQPLSNKTGGAVNDVHIEFKDGTVGGAKVLDFQDDRTAGTITAGGTKADFTLPNNIADQSGAILLFVRKRIPNTTKASPAAVDTTKSNWTLGGVNKGPVNIFGNLPPIEIEPDFFTKQASAVFSNTSGVAVTYSNVRLYADNDLTKLNLDEFEVPTGTLVTGVPTTFTLLDSESLSLSFGVLDPLKYALVLADVESSLEPGQIMTMGSALNVPEPSTAMLLTIGLAALAATRRPRG